MWEGVRIGQEWTDIWRNLMIICSVLQRQSGQLYHFMFGLKTSEGGGASVDGQGRHWAALTLVRHHWENQRRELEERLGARRLASLDSWLTLESHDKADGEGTCLKQGADLSVVFLNFLRLS